MKQNKIIKNLLIILSLFANPDTKAQLVKLYATKDDYISDKYETPAQSIIMQDLINPKKKLTQSVIYQFYSPDNTLRYQIANKILLIEYNDSLYINIRMLKDKDKKRFGRGFVKIKDQDGLIFFESYPEKSSSIEPIYYMLFGIAGGEIIRRTKLETTPTIYHHYNPETDIVEPINKQQVIALLKHDSELLSIFNKEPDQEHIQILSLYAKAFFIRKVLKEKKMKDIDSQKQSPS